MGQDGAAEVHVPEGPAEAGLVGEPLPQRGREGREVPRVQQLPAKVQGLSPPTTGAVQRSGPASGSSPGRALP